MQTENDGRNDFDFLTGSWIMRHRRLKERLRGCTEWEEFDGTAVGRKLPNIVGHSDEVVMNRESGPAHGYTLRLFDLKSKEWSIYWATGASCLLDVPMIGKFKDGVGEFYSHEVWEDSTSSAASCGRRSLRTLHSGNRHFPSTAGKRGKRIG